MMRRPFTPVRVIAAAAAALISLSACAGGELRGGPSGTATTTPSAPESAFAPTATPTSQATMLDKAPADFSEVKGEGFRISAPSEFQRHRSTSSNGQPMLTLERPSSNDALPMRVVVIRDVEPRSPAVEQSYALEASKAAGAQDKAGVVRTRLPTPEEQSAYLVTWQETRPGADGGTVDVTYWQLMYQVNAKLILNVVALAPTEDFPTSDVSTILRTFRADPSGKA